VIGTDWTGIFHCVGNWLSCGDKTTGYIPADKKSM